MRSFAAITILLVNFIFIGSALAADDEVKDDSACVEVEVNGVRAPSYNCLSQKLTPSAKPNKADGKAPQIASEAIVQRPSNQLGLFNRAATSNRMGNTFGTSVYPQRPPTRP